MISVVGVSFSDSNKIYYFLPNDIDLKVGDKVIVDTERGQQFGIVMTNLIEIDREKLVAPLKEVIKKATLNDEKKNEKNIKMAIKALEDANRLVDELNLKMKITSASFTFDGSQLLFNFLSDERIDFRELAKSLASIYHTRIELRQIGVRDKAKQIGGLGQCGRQLCCSTFLKDLNSVSINMAKNQNLALNPQKINGCCGRLMCCLDYENEVYSLLKKDLPKINQIIDTKEGKGKVIDLNILERKYEVELEDGKIIEIDMK